MKNKLLAIMLSIAVAVTFMPTGAFATNNNTQSVYKTSQYKHIKYKVKSGKGSVKIAKSDLENIQQQCIEILKEQYDESVLNHSKYSESVWKEITTIYQTEVDVINRAKSIDEITQKGMFGLTVSDRISNAIDMIAVLGTYTIRNGYEDIETIVSDTKATKKDVFSKYKKSDYNTYYWEKISNKSSELDSALDSVPSADSELNQLYDGLVGVAECASIMNEIKECAPEGYFTDDEDEDVFEIVFYFGDDEDEEGYELEDKWIYTKKEIKEAKEGIYTDLSELVVEITSKDTSGKAYEKAERVLEQFNKEIKNMYCAEDLLEAYDDAASSIYDIAAEYSDEVQPSTGDVVRLKTAIENLQDTYLKKNYSDKMWKKLNEIFDEEFYNGVYDFTYTSEQAATKETKKEARDAYVTKVKAKADKVLNKSQEKYYNKLAKKYKNKKKYNQKKVKKILAKASDEFSKCTTEKQLKKVYKKYNAKLKKTRK